MFPAEISDQHLDASGNAPVEKRGDAFSQTVLIVKIADQNDVDGRRLSSDDVMVNDGD